MSNMTSNVEKEFGIKDAMTRGMSQVSNKHRKACP